MEKNSINNGEVLIKCEKQFINQIFIKEEIQDENDQLQLQLLNTELVIKEEIFNEDNLKYEGEQSININQHVSNDFYDKTIGFSNQNHIHVDTNTISSEVCHKTYREKISLTRHSSEKKKLAVHQRIHSGEKPFTCDVCDKKYTRKSCLIIHQRTHTGEKPYACDVCKKRFSEKGSLTRHQRIRHSGENPFTSSQKLYPCDVCDREFTQKSSLLIHERTHTGEKPFSCDACDKTFRHKSTLTHHQRARHSSEKPFEKTLTEKLHLIKHQRTPHTGDKPYP